LADGRVDAISSLYSKEKLADQEEFDYFQIMVENKPEPRVNTMFKEIMLIVPEGFRDSLSFDTTKSARICLGRPDKCRVPYRAKIRAMIKKLPGFKFTGYMVEGLDSQELISETQYRDLIEDYFRLYPETKENF
jgi:hypothetical protein